MTSFSEIYTGPNVWLENSTIFLTLAGSRAYGTETPTSDYDYRGIVIPPKEQLYGFMQNFEQVVCTSPHDLVIYSLQKFMKLAADCNPNIIEILNTDKASWVLTTPVFEELFANRYLFLSSRVRHTFSGYAVSQLKRIKSHRNWLLNPPTHKPTRTEFGLSETKQINKSTMGAFDNIVEKHDVKLDSSIMELFAAEKRYASAMQHYNQYKNWENKRNPSRHALEAEHGYDTKHAFHLVRLMRMCKEILSTGEVIVKRPDADELLEIRNGSWKYDDLIAWAESVDKEIEQLAKKTELPKKPNHKALEKLCISLFEMHYNK